MDSNRASEDEVELIGLKFEAPVNEDGVVDGLVLAEAMFEKGLALILSYTGGCLGCAGAVMGVFGDRVYQRARKSWREEGGVPSSAMVFEEDAERRAAAILKAAEVARPRVRQLLLENAARGGNIACKH